MARPWFATKPLGKEEVEKSDVSLRGRTNPFFPRQNCDRSIPCLPSLKSEVSGQLSVIVEPPPGAFKIWCNNITMKRLVHAKKTARPARPRPLSTVKCADKPRLVVSLSVMKMLAISVLVQWFGLLPSRRKCQVGLALQFQSLGWKQIFALAYWKAR